MSDAASTAESPQDATKNGQAQTATPQCVAVIGAGVMGRALLAGLVRSGWPTQALYGTARSVLTRDQLEREVGVKSVSNAEAVANAKTVVLTVKPQDAGQVLGEVCPHLRPGTVVVSMMAGVPTGFVEERLPAGTAVVRAMPNTPALVDAGMTAVSPGQHCTAQQMAEVTNLLRATGLVVEVAERHQDAVTAISGSGPAYVFYVVEAMIEAGVLLGLPRSTSTELVVQTVLGASMMLRETGEHPTVLREQVSSPAGTTMAALRQLDDHKVRAAFLTAMEAARDRSRTLGEG